MTFLVTQYSHTIHDREHYSPDSAASMEDADAALLISSNHVTGAAGASVCQYVPHWEMHE